MLDMSKRLFGGSNSYSVGEKGGTSVRNGSVVAVGDAVTVLMDGSSGDGVQIDSSESFSVGDRVTVLVESGVATVMPVDGAVDSASKEATDYIGDTLGDIRLVVQKDGTDPFIALCASAEDDSTSGMFTIRPDGTMVITQRRSDVSQGGFLDDWVTGRAANAYGGYTTTYASGRMVVTGSVVLDGISGSTTDDGKLPNYKAFKSNAYSCAITACNGDWDACRCRVVGVSLRPSGSVLVHWDAAPSTAHRVNFMYEIW